MKLNIIVLCSVFQTFISCQSDLKPPTKIKNTQVVERNKNLGKLELSAFKTKYENNWTAKPTYFPCSDGSSFKVYKIDCIGECKYPEFLNRKSPGKSIKKEDFNELIQILKDPKSYDNTTAACYEPKFALVVYDSDNIPLEFLSICLNCNSFRTYPGEIQVAYADELLYGFSNLTREKLRKLFLKWGIPYYGFSSLWDDEQAYENYLKNKNQSLLSD